MIVVDTVDGGAEIEGTRFSTDEHNNLLVWAGPQGDRLVRVFAQGCWTVVGGDED